MKFAARAARDSQLILYNRHRLDHRRRQSTSARTPAWPSSTCPSPHQVLGVGGDELRYSKKNFYALVKLYHPDSNIAPPEVASLPPATRLERYHLLVKANEILSDPHKRRLYELGQIGWPKRDANTPTYERARPVYRHTTYAYPGMAAPTGLPPEAHMYIVNSLVAILLAAVAMAGAILQFQDKSARMHSVRVAAILNETILEGLDSAVQLQGGTAKEERIIEFLARRRVRSGIGADQILFEDVVDSENICRH